MKEDFAPFNHGGNIYRYAEEIAVPWEEIIDFSASINPLGPPAGVIAALRGRMESLRHYPDPEARVLKEALGKKLACDPALILAGNGSTELIYLLVRTLGPKKILLLAPTYSEYERAFKAVSPAVGEGSVYRLLLSARDDFACRAADFIEALSTMADEGPGGLAFLCNPNNPTGGFLPRAEVVKIAAVARERGCYLVVDEAYIDFLASDESVVKEVEKNPYLIVLRSLTKFYGFPGLRLGCGIFPPALHPALYKQKEPWSVNTLAQIAGVAALTDRDYEKETFRVVEEGKEILLAGLARLGIKSFPSVTNFLLVTHPEARRILVHLKKKGIMVRDCANFAGLDETYLRIAVRGEGDNKRLLRELEELWPA